MINLDRLNKPSQIQIISQESTTTTVCSVFVAVSHYIKSPPRSLCESSDKLWLISSPEFLLCKFKHRIQIQRLLTVTPKKQHCKWANKCCGTTDNNWLHNEWSCVLSFLAISRLLLWQETSGMGEVDIYAAQLMTPTSSLAHPTNFNIYMYICLKVENRQ